MKKIALYVGLLLAGALIGLAVTKLWTPNQPNSAQSQAEHVHPTEEISQIWTCSMHPEIEQDGPGTCPICGMELVPKNNISEDQGLDPSLFYLSDRALALADVQTDFIEISHQNGGIGYYTGKISAADAASKTQSAYVAGRIEKLLVNTTGKNVRKGQVLARIYSPELLTAQQELLTAHKRKAENPSLYQAVYNKLKQWKWSDSQIEKLLKTKAPQPYSEIRAMVNGEVIAKNVNEGAYVEAGQSLFEIADLSTVWAVIDIPESQVNLVKEGDRVNLSTSSEQDIVGRIDLVYPFLDSATRTVQVRVVIPNPDRKLKPGMLLRAGIESSLPDKESLLVPKSAVLWTGKRSIVYVAHRDDYHLNFEMREIELGNAQGDYYPIISGLKPHEEIVTQGAFTVDAAAQLQGRPSMMSKDDHKIIHISEEDQLKFDAFMAYYFTLKDAFIASNAKKVTQIAQEELPAIDQLHLHIEDRALNLWNKVLVNWHKLAHTEMGIKEQRLLFKALNQDLVPLAQTIKNRSEMWYLLECPMADSNTGGNWISLEPDIINPYFGEEMLHCGSVENTWHPQH